MNDDAKRDDKNGVVFRRDGEVAYPLRAEWSKHQVPVTPSSEGTVTPRTDALVEYHDKYSTQSEARAASLTSHARQLERELVVREQELAAAEERLARSATGDCIAVPRDLAERLDKLCTQCCPWSNLAAEAGDELAALLKPMDSTGAKGD